MGAISILALILAFPALGICQTAHQKPTRPIEHTSIRCIEETHGDKTFYVGYSFERGSKIGFMSCAAQMKGEKARWKYLCIVEGTEGLGVGYFPIATELTSPLERTAQGANFDDLHLKFEYTRRPKTQALEERLTINGTRVDLSAGRLFIVSLKKSNHRSIVQLDLALPDGGDFSSGANPPAKSLWHNISSRAAKMDRVDKTILNISLEPKAHLEQPN